MIQNAHKVSRNQRLCLLRCWRKEWLWAWCVLVLAVGSACSYRIAWTRLACAKGLLAWRHLQACCLCGRKFIFFLCMWSPNAVENAVQSGKAEKIYLCIKVLDTGQFPLHNQLGPSSTSSAFSSYRIEKGEYVLLKKKGKQTHKGI